MSEKHSTKWGTKDEIMFLEGLPNDRFIRLYHVLKNREWGELDRKRIMNVINARYSTLAAMRKV